MAPKPLAAGTLAETPLPQLLLYIEQRGLSGTLAVWPDAAVDGPSLPPTRLLLEEGVLVAWAQPRSPSGPGEAVLPAELSLLFARCRAPYAFYDQDLLPTDRQTGSVRLAPAVAHALRSDLLSPEVLDATLGRLPPHVSLSLTDSTEALVQQLQLEATEQALLATLARGPISLAGFLSEVGDELELSARRLAYLLLISRCWSLGTRPSSRSVAQSAPGGTAPAAGTSAQATPRSSGNPGAAGVAGPRPRDSSSPGSIAGPGGGERSASGVGQGGRTARSGQRGPLSGSPLPAVPPGLADPQRQRWQEVLTVAHGIESQNYFEMLGLGVQANKKEIRSAFLRAAKRWHPDRLPAELAPLREAVQRIFGYMSEANTCLSDDQQRMRYLETVRGGGGTPATDRLMERILDNAMQYERVVILARRRSYREALELLDQMLELTPDEADYHAMRAWLLLQLHPPAPGAEAPLAEMLAAADRALELHARHEKANLHKAQVLRRMGQTQEALEYFRRVVDINPHNLEAGREVRVAQMRAEASQPPKARKAGFLEGLFRSKK